MRLILVKAVRLCLTLRKLLEKFDQNFIIKSCVRTILDLNVKVLPRFFQKASGVRGKALRYYIKWISVNGSRTIALAGVWCG